MAYIIAARKLYVIVSKHLLSGEQGNSVGSGGGSFLCRP